jgi:hypothetical protein
LPASRHGGCNQAWPLCSQVTLMPWLAPDRRATAVAAAAGLPAALQPKFGQTVLAELRVKDLIPGALG